MRISVHSVVIAAASPTVSDALIKCHRDGGTPPPELLVHCECSALEECVRFCYTGDLSSHTAALLTQLVHFMHGYLCLCLKRYLLPR